MAEALRLQVEARKAEIRKKVGKEVQNLYLAADKRIKKRRAEERLIMDDFKKKDFDTKKLLLEDNATSFLIADRIIKG